jgi:hypothetical protein
MASTYQKIYFEEKLQQGPKGKGQRYQTSQQVSF